MNTSLKIRIKRVIEIVNRRETPKWKPGSECYHYEKRKSRGHIPKDWEIKDYNKHIMNIMNNIENEVHLYYLKDFEQDYFVFDDGKWIVIIGANGVMESAFLSKNSKNYLLPEKGYTYLGKVKEVLE